MLRKLKLILPALLALLWPSCDTIHDSLEDCGFYLQFVYDYNLEHNCSFTVNVPCVDVFVFDENDRLLFIRSAQASELIDGNKMYLNEDLYPDNTYQVLAVGGLSEYFCLTDSQGNECCAGETTLTEVQLALERAQAEVSHEFSPIWFSQQTVTAEYPGYKQVVPVPLMKYTNQFNLVLYRRDHAESQQKPTASDGGPLYTFEIATPEGAVYGHDNAPLTQEEVTYTPYALKTGASAESYSVGNLNTVRLMDTRKTRATGDSGYSLVVRNRRTFKEAWNIDLLDLLAELNSDMHQYDELQEFLDRKSVWDIAILHNGGGTDEEHDAFIAVGIQIGPWIKWFHDMPL